MSTCNSHTSTKTAPCPVNGKYYKQVKRKTILHQVTRPWARQLPEQAYYYCDDPQCDVVYFSEDASLINSNDMRTEKTVRSNTICFCFDISKDNLKDNKATCRDFVTEQTRQSACDCEIRNPSGKCCLKEFN
ncbi:MAG: hypothetical protein P8Y24_03970 [Gammaproteobacteria bacterium]